MNIWQMRAKGTRCPYCQRFNDIIESPFDPGAKPKAGDYTVCAGCQRVSRFDADNHLVAVDEEELLARDAQMAELVELVKTSENSAEAVGKIHDKYGRNVVQ